MRLPIRVFRGLRTVVQQKGLPNEECSDVQNFLFSPGLMRTRPGYFKSNTTALTGAITGLYDYKKRTGRFLLSADDQYIRKENILYPNFVAWPQVGTAPLTVYFMDITVDDSSEITSWLWDFGDGQTSTDHHPTNVYAATGLYTVTMTIFCGTKSFIKERVNYIQVGEVENPDDPPDYPEIPTPPSSPSFPYPTVTSITPSSVIEGYSATAVTVGGTNFRQDPSAILIGTTKTTGLGYTSSIALTGTVPAGLTEGTYDVIVANPDDKTGGLENGFRVLMHIDEIYHSEVLSDYIYLLANTGSGFTILKLSCSTLPDFLIIEQESTDFKFLNVSKTDGSNTRIYPSTSATIEIEDAAFSYEFVVLGDNVYVSYGVAEGRVDKYSLITGLLVDSVSGFGFAGDSNGVICTDGTNLFCVGTDWTTHRLIKITPSLTTTIYNRDSGELGTAFRIQADSTNVYVYHDSDDGLFGGAVSSYISKWTKTNGFVNRFEVDFSSRSSTRALSEFKTDGTNHYFWLYGTTAVKKYTISGSLVSTFTFNSDNPSTGGLALKR